MTTRWSPRQPRSPPSSPPVPTRGLAETKKRIRAAWANDLDTELDEERDAMRMLGGTHDYAEGVAAFTEKRKPSFTGR